MWAGGCRSVDVVWSLMFLNDWAIAGSTATLWKFLVPGYTGKGWGALLSAVASDIIATLIVLYLSLWLARRQSRLMKEAGLHREHQHMQGARSSATAGVLLLAGMGGGLSTVHTDVVAELWYAMVYIISSEDLNGNLHCTTGYVWLLMICSAVYAVVTTTLVALLSVRLSVWIETKEVEAQVPYRVLDCSIKYSAAWSLYNILSSELNCLAPRLLESFVTQILRMAVCVGASVLTSFFLAPYLYPLSPAENEVGTTTTGSSMVRRRSRANKGGAQAMVARARASSGDNRLDPPLLEGNCPQSDQEGDAAAAMMASSGRRRQQGRCGVCVGTVCCFMPEDQAGDSAIPQVPKGISHAAGGVELRLGFIGSRRMLLLAFGVPIRRHQLQPSSVFHCAGYDLLSPARLLLGRGGEQPLGGEARALLSHTSLRVHSVVCLVLPSILHRGLLAHRALHLHSASLCVAACGGRLCAANLGVSAPPVGLATGPAARTRGSTGEGGAEARFS